VHGKLEEYVLELRRTLDELNVRIEKLRDSATAKSIVAAFVTFRTGKSKVTHSYSSYVRLIYLCISSDLVYL
jgi:hypothetical protein